MKKLIFSGILGCILLAVSFTGFSQSTFPQGFNYQAIARNASGAAIINTDMKVKVGILSDTIANTLVWEEEHSVRTNGYGLFTLVVGGPKGTRTGGSAATFNIINWSASQMFIYIQIKNPATASTYTSMGKAKLWSVPYALLAGKSEQDLSSPFSVSADTVYTGHNLSIGSNRPLGAQLAVVSENDASEEPLFEVRRKDGQPVFTVYNDAVTINVPMDGKKGSPSRGGFAVGGFDESKGRFVTDLFRITADSARIYVNNTPSIGKGSPSRGGFAVGGFDDSKAGHTELLRVTHDSTRIYTNESSDKGFAVGYLSTAQVRTDNFMKLNKSNYFIGHGSGVRNTTGTRNAFFGYESGVRNTTGTDNIFIGYNAGYYNTYGINNIFVGTKAGFFNSSQPESTQWSGDDNIFIGDFSGYNNILGFTNIAIGTYSGYNNNTNYNVYIGYRSGYSNVTGIQQVFVGDQAGYMTTGRMNTFLGAASGTRTTSGANNCFAGAVSGSMNRSGSHNTFLGNQAGFTQTGGDTLYNYNTFVGSMAGASGNGDIGSGNICIGYESGYRNGNNLGDNNIFIGNRAGYDATGSQQLYINYGAGAPLIYGDFANDRIRLNANVGINYNGVPGYGLIVDTPEAPPEEVYALYVMGSAYAYGGTWVSSDLALKKNLEPIKNSLEKVLSLKGYTYEWDRDKFPERKYSMIKQVGLIAQDVEKVLPELVKPDMDGYKAVSYEKMVPVLIEAIKEQQVIIEELRQQIKSLDDKINKLN